MDGGVEIVQRARSLSQNLCRPGRAVESRGISHHACRISALDPFQRRLARCSAASHFRGRAKPNYANEAERLSGRLRSDLDYVTIGDIFEFGLHEYLETIQERLVELSDAIYSTYCASEVEEVRA